MPEASVAYRQVWAHDLRLLGARYGARIAVTDLDGAVTYEELVERAFGLARHLAHAGIGPGDRVATLIPNSAAAVHASWGIAICGACEVTLNPAQAPDEQAWCIEVAAPRVLLHDGRAPALPGGDIQVMSCTSAPHGAGAPMPPVAPCEEPEADWGRILFTSGTTGRPKGVVHTHQARWLAAQLLRQSLAETMSEGSTLLLTPFSHGASLLAYALLPAGKPVHLLPGLDPAVVGPLVRSGAVAHLFAPPAVLVRLVELLRGEYHASVRTVLTGTAPLPAALYQDARRIFGPRLRITYGMTEIFNPITVLEPAATDVAYQSLGEDASGLVGWPAPGVEISVRDEAGVAVADGVEGEIFVHAKHMYAGYLRGRGQFEPAPAFHPTGDIGRLDAARGLRLSGRLHDVIKSGGYKVHPQEVESALRERGIEGDFAVLGLPSQRWGEIVVLARAQPEGESFDDVVEAATRLTHYKRPRLFAALPALPRNAIGKIDRRRIREQIVERWELLDGAHPAFRRRIQPR